MKSEITRLGTGIDAKVKVKLKDGAKIKGYVSEIKDNEFVVTDSKTGQSILIPYTEAKQVKGNNLSSKTIIGIGLGIAVGVIILIFAAKS